VALALGELLHGETSLSKKTAWAHILSSYIRSLEGKAKRYDAMTAAAPTKSETRQREIRVAAEDGIGGRVVFGVQAFDREWLEALADDATRGPVRIVLRADPDPLLFEVKRVVAVVRDPQKALGDEVRAGDIGLELATIGVDLSARNLWGEVQWLAKVIRRWTMEETVDDGC
jgi:hypothetical protein